MTPAFVRQLFIYEYILQTYKKRLSHPNQDILEEKDYKYDNSIRFFAYFVNPFPDFFTFSPKTATCPDIYFSYKAQRNKHKPAVHHRYF